MSTNGLGRPGEFPTILKQPSTDDAMRPFWEATVEGRLVAPRCTNCGTFRLPATPISDGWLLPVFRVAG